MSSFYKHFVFVSFLTEALCAQVRLSTNLSATIPLDKSIVFEVRLEKENIGSFTRFQLDVPPSITIEDIDSHSGVFSFEDNKVKIIWVSTPSEPEFSIKMKLLPVKQPMKGVFTFRYFYVETDLKKEWVSKEFKVTVKDTILSPLFSAPMVSLKHKGGDTELSSAGSTKTATAGKSPEQIRQQVDQLRKDAIEAKTVGQREKRKAETKLNQADAAEKTCEAKPAGAAKTLELARINEEKNKAKEELLVAERVLILSNTLDSNANEIEKLNRNLNPHIYALDGKQKDKPEIKPVMTNETNYRIQVGAFKEPPTKARFERFGKVNVIQEGAVYKVLVGEFADKADAYELRDRINQQTPGCFVVKFTNGKRVN